MRDNSSITQENFQTLLGWLDSNAESAGEKYEKIRHRLIRMFVGRGCHEAELLADQTIDRVIDKVPHISSGYVGEPAAYFYGVAHKIHLEWLRGQKRQRETTFIDLTTPADEEGDGYACLERCLLELPPESREMILEYYRGEKRAKIDRRKELAKKRGISIGALQIKASRIRSRLAICVNECVKAL